LAFVPDGEPTLDTNLGDEISILKRTGIRVAVLSNSSLIWQQDVRRALQKSDVVSLKVDAVSETIWRRINRPHRTLRLALILKGIAAFAREFKGTIMSETMLIGNMLYGDEFERISKFLGNLEKLNRAYIAVPTRPPAESWVEPPQEEILNTAFQTFSETLGVDRVEQLIGYEGNAFAFTGNIEEDLLNITAVHPMRKEAVEKLLTEANADWQVITRLLREDKIKCIEFQGNKYYLCKSAGRKKMKDAHRVRESA
jgi:wyosine [tRNA(Phe)-imidazoG37] synthetase (radical SAM superfamily)